MIQDLLFELLGGDRDTKLVSHGYDCYDYPHDDFKVCLEENHGWWLVSIDLHSSFNKVSQAPIHFIYSEYEKFSKRKKKRIHQALNYLLTHKKDSYGFFGRLPNFDDLDGDVRREFYNLCVKN